MSGYYVLSLALLVVNIGGYLTSTIVVRYNTSITVWIVGQNKHNTLERIDNGHCMEGRVIKGDDVSSIT